LKSILPIGQVALKFCLPWACLNVFVFFFLVGRRLAWAFAHWPSENEKLLAQQENLVILDDWTALFLSPAKADKCVCMLTHAFSTYCQLLDKILSG